jgi:hypothetical protein
VVKSSEKDVVVQLHMGKEGDAGIFWGPSSQEFVYHRCDCEITS